MSKRVTLSFRLRPMQCNCDRKQTGSGESSIFAHVQTCLHLLVVMADWNRQSVTRQKEKDAVTFATLRFSLFGCQVSTRHQSNRFLHISGHFLRPPPCPNWFYSANQSKSEQRRGMRNQMVKKSGLEIKTRFEPQESGYHITLDQTIWR